jgi:hypothetical protein
MRVQRQPYSVYPQFLMLKGRHPYDHTDALAASVCSSIKRRGERFESDQELCSWLDADKVSYDSDSLAVALQQLESIGRLRRPRADQWNSDQPLPGMYVEPRISNDSRSARFSRSGPPHRAAERVPLGRVDGHAWGTSGCRLCHAASRKSEFPVNPGRI